jgi:hypothetical protein
MPQISSVFDENGLFQQPRLITTTIALTLAAGWISEQLLLRWVL